MDMKEQRFGIEIEMTGLTRESAAGVLSEYFGSPYSRDGGYYGEYSVLDGESRRWKVMSDGSIDCQRKENGRLVHADSNYSVELVSPICRWEGIETIQEIVRRLRGTGMLADQSCGIHVHVDASPHNAKTLRNALLASESHNPRKDIEREESTSEPALRPAEKEAKPCVHALLSEFARKSADATRPERVTAIRPAIKCQAEI